MEDLFGIIIFILLLNVPIFILAFILVKKEVIFDFKKKLNHKTEKKLLGYFVLNLSLLITIVILNLILMVLILFSEEEDYLIFSCQMETNTDLFKLKNSEDISSCPLMKCLSEKNLIDTLHSRENYYIIKTNANFCLNRE